MLTDVELLCAAQTGDTLAYEELQERLEPPIRRYVRRLVGVADEDIIQDVFIALYFHLGDINPPEKLRPYVYRIARNRCYDEFRRWERNPTVSLDDEPMQLWVSYAHPEAGGKPDELTHWMLLYLEVQEAIARLPENQRDALVLFSEENLSYAEIAEVMQTTLGTIKSRLYHAKQNLRRMVRPETLQAIENG